MDKDPSEENNSQEPLQSIEDLKGEKSSEKTAKKESLGGSIKNKITKTTESANNTGNNPREEAQEKVKQGKKNLDRAAAVARASQRALTLTVAALTNPITWVLAGVALLTVVVISGIQIVGKSDFAKNCDSSGNTTISAQLSEDEKERANQVATYLTSNKIESFGNKPMTKEQAAGIIGNMKRESSINSTTVQTVSIKDPDYYKSCDNECVLSWGDVGGKAVGLIQWDGGRRIKLVEYAKSKGKAWYDANAQLEFLYIEANGSHKSSYKKTFVDCSSVNECVAAFCKDIEVAGDPALNERVDYAEAFLKEFKPSTISGGSGSVSTCSGDSSGMDTSSLAKFAISIAYPWEEYNKSNVAGGDTYGKNNATSAYKEAKALAVKNGGADPMGDLYASCDRFVATILKATKADVDVPWGSTTEQYAYFSKSPKWKKVSCKERKPGDVIITTTNGHVMMYVGDVNGRDSLSSASYLNRVGATGPMEGCVGDAFNADTWTNTEGFRLK